MWSRPQTAGGAGGVGGGIRAGEGHRTMWAWSWTGGGDVSPLWLLQRGQESIEVTGCWGKHWQGVRDQALGTAPSPPCPLPTTGRRPTRSCCLLLKGPDESTRDGGSICCGCCLAALRAEHATLTPGGQSGSGLGRAPVLTLRPSHPSSAPVSSTTEPGGLNAP